MTHRSDKLLRAEVARLEAENAELRLNVGTLDDQLILARADEDAAVRFGAERDRLAAVIEQAADALDPDVWGPTRDKALKARMILTSVPTDTALRERDAEKWHEGRIAPSDAPNPYRTRKETDR